MTTPRPEPTSEAVDIARRHLHTTAELSKAVLYLDDAAAFIRQLEATIREQAAEIERLKKKPTRRTRPEFYVEPDEPAQADGVAPKMSHEELRRRVLAAQWTPEYLNFAQRELE